MEAAACFCPTISHKYFNSLSRVAKHQILFSKNYCTVVYPANHFISAFCSPLFFFIVVNFENDTGAVTYSTLLHLLQ